ncbi:hypothetical protein R0J90_22680, partial [Micrococcus sp. SIMBA_144]
DFWIFKAYAIHNKKTHEVSESYIHIKWGQIILPKGGGNNGAILYFHAYVPSRKLHPFVIESY